MIVDDTVQSYFDSIEKEVKRAYELAGAARAKGFDPEPEVNIPIARDLAARVEGLVGTMCPELIGSGLAESIRNLEKEYGKNDERVAIIAGRDIAKGGNIKFDTQIKAIEIGLRVAIAYLTLGVVTAPLEGLSEVKMKKNDDGTEYLAIYFAGPIRSAGGTASAMAVLAADFIRIHCNIAPYKPRDNELKRYSTEVEDYYSRVTAKQYHPTKEEIEFIIKNVPVEINGDPTEKLEVSNFKDLERVETNQIRGGMCLVLLDGLPLKAEKMLKRIRKYPKEYKLEHWIWLESFIAMKKKIHAAKDIKSETSKKYTPNAKYVDKIIAGRPVISYPALPGGFRLRYGRSRTGGLATTSIHPLTMQLIPFLAVGTQIATELPGKATVCTPCDTIEGPVVLMKNGDVIEIESKEQIKKLNHEIKEILSVGDLLIPFGEFVSNGHMLLPSSYVEEWWAQEVDEALKKHEKKYESLSKYTKKPFPPPSLDLALKISDDLKVPLHPYYNFFWHDIDKVDLKKLIEWFSTRKETSSKDMLILNKNGPKRILEILCAPHVVKDKEESIHITGKSLILDTCLGKPSKNNLSSILKTVDDAKTTMDAIQKLSGIPIREKGITRVGMKMGRPEKAEKRILKGRPQILFPCGDAGGRMRNLAETYKAGEIESTVSIYRCGTCRSETYFSYCHKCGSHATKAKACRVCNKIVDAPTHCNMPTAGYKKVKLDVKTMMDNAKKNIDMPVMPELFKSVKGVFGASKNIEPLEKGLLRTKYDLYVNKDGTTRSDSTDVSLTHFKPREISVSVKTLRSWGYTKDIDGKELENEEQVLALFPQDIIVSDNIEFSTADYLIKISRFIDDLLVKFYKLEPFYNIRSKEDLIGHLVIGLAPHTSAGIIGRIIGYTPARVCFAHPFWHAGKRRNCFNGDEKILTYDKNEFHLDTIKDITEKNLANDTEKDSFGTEYKKITGLKTYAFNNNTGRFELADITHVSRHIAEDMIEITTKSGRKITVTKDHPLLDRNGRKIKAEDATEVLVPWNIDNLNIQSGNATKKNETIDLLAITNNKNAMIRTDEDIFCTGGPGGATMSQLSASFGMNYKTFTNYAYRKSYPVEIIHHLNKDIIKNKNYMLGNRNDKVSVKPEIELNEDFLCLLGLYIAEGYTKKDQKGTHQVTITACKPWAKEHIKKNIESVFGLKASVSGNAVTICSYYIHELFRHLKIGEDAKSKRVPEFIYSLPKEKISAFLKGYFSGDGSCALNSTLEVNVTSVNKWLIDSTSILLTFLGIRHSIREEDREIKSRQILEFYGKPKQLHSYKIRIYSHSAQKFIEDIGFIGKKQEHANTLLEKWLKKKGTSRTQFKGDAFIDRIVKKNPVKCGEKFTYDLTVDTHHNLICSGIVAGNCDGDEDSVMLLMDALLNFSRQFMPDTRGGRTMDAPLVLTTCLDPEEVDDESWNVDVDDTYPLGFYRSTLEYPALWDLKSKPRIIEELIGKEEVFHTRFTHDTYDISEGPHRSRYTQLDTMIEKLYGQLELGKKIRAVDANKVAEAVLSKHFLRDIKGNLRKFSKQGFRCANCNDKFRRMPLIGRCPSCDGKIMLTISEGSARKYIEPSKRIMDDFKITSYLRQQFLLLEKEADSIFGKKARQLNLSKFQ